MPNKYPGRCDCGTQVAAHAGIVRKIKNFWKVVCSPCVRTETAAQRPPKRCRGCEMCDGEGGDYAHCQAQMERVYG